MKLPVLFLGHGSPMNAVLDTPYSRNWRRLGGALSRRYGSGIRAVLAVSAHWCTDGTAVTAMRQPRTIHDFGGFPQVLFDMQYPAQGSPELAESVCRLLGGKAAADYGWGLDHGTWGVLCHIFPKADIPVVQLSLNMRLNAREHFELGRKLAPLRTQGILIAASGSIVHNLRLIDRYAPDTAGTGYPWAERARSLVNGWLANGHTRALTDDNAYPPEIRMAAPTPEHWWPLLYAAGAAEPEEPLQIFNDDIVGKSLSMTSVVFGDAGLV